MTGNCKLENKCGKVEANERDEIKELYFRKNALKELFLTLPKLENVYSDKL